jgi:3-hydroxyacyl-CoA dehydrogenase/enoyl-CoA hydratase/3-hydroxybutyryl-CoA epimerase
MNLEHWILVRDADGIAWATLDQRDASTNVLSADVMAELALILDDCERDPNNAPNGLIFRSGKEAGFIAGADIEEFARLDSADAARTLVARGWNLYNRLASVPYPTLALVRGHCVGGGAELALACRYIVAVDEPGTKFSLPEVMLGILPGWGGMMRLPRRVAPPAALDLMLTGRGIDARRARHMGLADECAPPRLAEATARGLLLAGRPRKPRPLLHWLMNGPLKRFVASQARKQAAKRVRPEHYPAPYAIVDCWAKHDGNALATPDILDRIIGSPTTRNLVRVFFLQDRLKAFGKESAVAARRLHVVGAGVMGGDIAAWAALRGLTVTLQDTSLERIAAAIGRAGKLFGRGIKDKLARRAAFDRLIPDPAGEGAAHADVVIEAIFEDLQAKRSLLAGLETKMKPDAVLASNTSSLRLEDIATALKNPSRLVGIHFFNPVTRMPLVEVVEAQGADPAMLARAAAFTRQIDKLPLPVKSAPGFLVNAVLAPYMLEAMRCIDEGIAPETVDEAMLAFGMPMGPIELADTVGLDIAMAAGKQLANTAEPPRCLTAHVARNELGRKTGHGFYAYADGKPRKNAAGSVPAGLAQRLLAPLIARTQVLVADGIVADADLADAGVIFGAGFAPFTGGPMHYAAEMAIQNGARLNSGG